MRRSVVLLAAVAVMFSLCGACFAGGTVSDVKKAGELKVAIANFDSDPFYVGPGHMVEGFDVDLAKAVAEKLGVKLSIVRPEWVGGIDKAWTDGYDWSDFDIAISSITMRPDRAAKCDFSTPYYKTGQRAIALADSPMKTLDDAKKTAKKLVFMSGSVADAVVEKDFPRCTKIPIKDVAEIKDAVGMGMAEIGIYDGVALEKFAATHVEFKVLEGFLTEEEYGVATRKGSDMKAVVDGVLAEKKDAIYTRWF